MLHGVLSPLDSSGDDAPRAVRKAELSREGKALPFMVRAGVSGREKGMCRAALDGRGFAWCTREGTDLHGQGEAGATGGRTPDAREVSTAEWILLCHACHTAHHRGRIAITISHANRPLGVWYRYR